jgi:hypothetical protein
MVGSVFDRAPANPLDELEELKQILRPVEIAEAIGRRPETISRLRPDKPLSRRTERRLDDLHAVARRLFRDSRDPAAVRFELLRRRDDLGGRSLVDLVRAGEAAAALERVTVDEALDVDDELEAELLEAERAAGVAGAPVQRSPFDLDGHLAMHPELREPLARAVEVARALVGPQVELVPQVLYDEFEDEEPHLFLGLRTGLPVNESIDRLRDLYAEIGDLLAPFADRLSVGLA